MGLVGELSLWDNDFRRWWADHDVLGRAHGSKHYHHPVVGDMTLGHESMILGLRTAEPGPPSEQALRLLASWTSEQEIHPGV